MAYSQQKLFHVSAAIREEAAADRATCVASARAHNVLANLHRLEAAKVVNPTVR